MRIARVLLPSFSGFDLKCFRIDCAAAAGPAEASWTLSMSGPAEPHAMPERQLARELREFAPTLLHVYGAGPVPQSLITAAGAPWLADRALEASRTLLGRRPKARAKALLDEIHEPVAEEFFDQLHASALPSRPVVGTLRRGNAIASRRDLTEARIRRFRDDVEWQLFDEPLPASRMAALSLWVDPTDDEDDLDGLVCEAIVLGIPVVATRTAANRRRTDDGRAATLCPKGDPNEMAHAIVTALFKPERTMPLRTAAVEIRERFRPAQRRAALLEAYAEVTR